MPRKISKPSTPIKLWEDDEIFIPREKESLLKWVVFIQKLFAASYRWKIEIFCVDMMKDNNPILTREFEFIYLWYKFKCYFSKTSKKMAAIFGAITNNPRDFNVSREITNHLLFYKWENKDILFSDKNAYSFVVQWPIDKVSIIDLCKHINFYMSFYDRSTLRIMFIQWTNEISYTSPCLFKRSWMFVTPILWTQIKPDILDIYEAALSTSSIRLKYIFYYQVIEYISYYFLDDDVKNKINKILKRPDLIQNSDDCSYMIIEELKQWANSKEDPFCKTIKYYVDIDDIAYDINTNIGYFSQDIDFIWWFSVDSIIDTKTKDVSDIDQNYKKKFFDSLIGNIWDIRNVLVHAREKRELRIISPSTDNDKKLLPYLYVLRRIVEYIMIRS